MSWTTGTQTEYLGASSANGAALASSTTPTLINPSAASAYLPANFWLPTYGINKAVVAKAWGVLSTTSTPNLTMELLANTTQGTRNSSGIIATTTATAQASSVTNVFWDLEVYLSCAATGSSGTFPAIGAFNVQTATTATQRIRMSSSTANPNTALTLSTQSAYYLELFATWGTNSASNTITCYGFSVIGAN
jgi:hypothetical protein